MSIRIPGPRSLQLANLLRKYESRGVTCLAPDFPVFWASADDARVVDVDGNTYIDLSSGFAVAGLGHSNPVVVSAISDQAATLMHAMADFHPSAIRARLLERLAEIAPGDLSKSYLCSTGSEAVEAALKTALIYNGRPRIAAFNGAYHGLSLGALEVCGLPFFRTPFTTLLGDRAVFFDYPRARDGKSAVTRTISAIEERLHQERDIGALIVEPIQGRGGMIVPPDGFLRALRDLCDAYQLVFILDEVYTGFGRTGALFAAEHEQVVPDLMCIGKAIANGFPISAAIGTAQIMDAWQPPDREALHTSTFLGNPMGCAAALATIAEIQRLRLVERAKDLGERLQQRFQTLLGNQAVLEVRGRGLFWGIEMRDVNVAESIVKTALRQGLIIFAEDAVVSVMPPLTIAEERLDAGLAILESLIQKVAA
ncbi:MAG: aspartate aminotransferase family protein [Candidatus Eremiobacteraeota bacterium]|nr:aspartate aminotransferase family protein [Candidatus Eremiobacteraeota bacterium]